MKNLMIMLASVMPEAMLLDELQESLTAYKLAPSDETKGKLINACALMVAKHASENTPGGVIGMMKSLDRIEQAEELLNPKSN